MKYLEVVLLLVVIGQLLRVMSKQQKAMRVARDTKSEASQAAHAAALAAATAQRLLHRIDGMGGTNNRAATRIEGAAAVVAEDLAAAHDRADAADSTEPGAAADAAASSPPQRD